MCGSRSAACRAPSRSAGMSAAVARVLGGDDRHVRVGVCSISCSSMRRASSSSSIGAYAEERAADGVERRGGRARGRRAGRARGRPPRSAGGPAAASGRSTCQPGCGSMQSTSTRAYASIRRVHPRDPSRTRASPSRAPTTASAARALGGWPVTASRNASRPSACSWASVSASTVAVRGTSRRSAISPNESPGPSSPRRRAVDDHLRRPDSTT